MGQRHFWNQYERFFCHLQGLFGTSWWRLGAVLVTFGAILCISWAILGASWASLWSFLGHLGAIWGHLERSWGQLGLSGAFLSSCLSLLLLPSPTWAPPWDSLGSSCRRSWAILGCRLWQTTAHWKTVCFVKGMFCEVDQRRFPDHLKPTEVQKRPQHDN